MEEGISCTTPEATNSAEHAQGFPRLSEDRAEKSEGTAAESQQEGK